MVAILLEQMGVVKELALTIAVDATSANTASKVVARDASGNFTATTITASGLTGVNSSNPVTISYAIIDGGSP